VFNCFESGLRQFCNNRSLIDFEILVKVLCRQIAFFCFHLLLSYIYFFNCFGNCLCQFCKKTAIKLELLKLREYYSIVLRVGYVDFAKTYVEFVLMKLKQCCPGEAELSFPLGALDSREINGL